MCIVCRAMHAVHAVRKSKRQEARNKRIFSSNKHAACIPIDLTLLAPPDTAVVSAKPATASRTTGFAWYM